MVPKTDEEANIQNLWGRKKGISATKNLNPHILAESQTASHTDF